MIEQWNRILAAFAVAWRAVARAFTPSSTPGESPSGELDTTLFGALTDDMGADQAPVARKGDVWNRGDESSYFAETDMADKTERH